MSEDEQSKGQCIHCGKPTLSSAVEFCENCLLMEIRTIHPRVRFFKADWTETQNPEECVYIKGIKLKKDAIQMDVEV